MCVRFFFFLTYTHTHLLYICHITRRCEQKLFVALLLFSMRHICMQAGFVLCEMTNSNQFKSRDACLNTFIHNAYTTLHLCTWRGYTVFDAISTYCMLWPGNSFVDLIQSVCFFRQKFLLLLSLEI